MGVVEVALREVADLPLAEAARQLVAAAIAAHRLDPQLHRVLAEQTPHVGPLAEVATFNNDLYGLFRDYLERHRRTLRPVDLDLAAFVCVTSIEALTHTAVIHRDLDDVAAEALVDEGTRLVVSYLT
jgi:hypothetical protein